MCDKYRLPFMEHFQAEPLAQHYEVSIFYKETKNTNQLDMPAEINYKKQI